MKSNSIFAKKSKSKFNTKKNYSSFWMDNDSDIVSRYNGLSSSVGTSTDLFKIIKLNNYRRAVTNFVKILTNMDIPVTWHGDTSYTNGKSVNLSTDIKDNNFDVTVGLALHEASHIKLTDFNVLHDLFEGKITSCAHFTASELQLCKEVLNWIEDRRIDHFVFSTSPGYKAYYHKLYDYYWNDKAIDKGFKSTQFCDASNQQSYMFHIINMLNPLFDSSALPGLDEITQLIDVKNISRLNNTTEALEISIAVTNIILENVKSAQNKQQQNNQSGSEKGSEEGDQDQSQSSGETGSSSSEGVSEESNEESNGESSKESNEESNGESNEESDGESSEESDENELQDLSDKDKAAVEKALNKMKDFLNGHTKKKSANKKLQKSLENTAVDNLQVQSVGGEDHIQDHSALMVDGINGSYFSDLISKIDQKESLGSYWEMDKEQKKIHHELTREIEQHTLGRYFGRWSRSEKQPAAVEKGLQMGAMLGKKLQLHNETRERVDNRLRSGKIDNRRLAHAGYGIDSIFHQISIDKYKKANLHISLDGSGSMDGKLWNSAIQMTAAIAKALTYTQNINLQVSIRATNNQSLKNEAPVVLSIYDSKKNNIRHLTKALQNYNCGSMTPEGLCFEAMYKQNQLVSGTNDMDSYFLNISDGMPGMNNYGGYEAINHTAKWVNKMTNDHNIKVLSFFLAEGDYESIQRSFNNSNTGEHFRKMYGKSAAVVNPDNVLDIARELNKKFMSR